MKRSLTLLILGALAAVPFASAQIVLDNFSKFESPNTYFTGDWEFSGDVNGTNVPRIGFGQGVGFYNFTGGSNSAEASAIRFFDTPLDITGATVLQLSARRLAGNVAPTLTVSLFDSLGGSAFAVLPTSAFAGAGFTTWSAALTFAPGFNLSDLTSFALSGNVVGGADLLDIAIDQLAVAPAPAPTPVPEASTYGLAGAVLLAGLVSKRRLRRK